MTAKQRASQSRNSVHEKALKVVVPDGNWALNDEIERGFLACLIQEPTLLVDVLDTIQEQDFSVLRWGMVYRLMKAVHQREGMFDIGMLCREIDRAKAQHGDLTMGAADTEMWLLDQIPMGIHPHNINKYAQKIREHAVRLRLLKAGHTIVQTAMNDTMRIDTLIDTALLEVEAAAELSPLEGEAFNRTVDGYFDHLEALLKAGPKETMTPTGMANIDRYGGLARKEVTVLAGRAKGGKTTMGLNIAQQVAKLGGFVVYFSIEMSDSEMLNRVFSNLTGIPKSKFRSGDLTPDEWSLFVKAAGQIADWKIALIDKTRLMKTNDMRVTPNRIRRVLRHIRQRPDLMVIDGLWLLDAEVPTDRRDMDIRSITMELANIASEYDVPILLLHQYNRAVASAERPDISHLAEGASVERNVHVIWGMHRVKLDDGSDITRIYVLGDRSGDMNGQEFDFTYDWSRSLYMPANIKKMDLTQL